MHNDYKKQMDDVHMPDHLKESIYQSIQEQASVPTKKRQFGVWRACVSCACVCMLILGAYTIINDQNQRATKELESSSTEHDMAKKSDQSSSDRSIQYQPIAYDVTKNQACDQTTEQNDICAKTGSAETYAGTSSFVADRYLVDVNSIYSVYNIQADNIQNRMHTLANQLGATYEENTNIFETEQYVITCDSNGNLQVKDKQLYAYETISNPETLKAMASKYYGIFRITQPVLTYTENGYSIQDEELTKQEQMLFSVELTTQKNVETNRYQVDVYGKLQDMTTIVSQVPIIDEQTAMTQLEMGRYYYSGTYIDQITSDDIQNVELIYGNSYSYLMPMYRFYINRNDQVSICNVLAISQEDLARIDETMWNFKVK